MSIAKFNIPADFVAYEDVTADQLRSYSEAPRQTQAGIFILVLQGSLKLSINPTPYRLVATDLLAIPPETFIRFGAASEDLRMHVVLFSQKFIQESGLGRELMEKFQVIGSQYVFSLPKVTFPLYVEMFAMLAHLYRTAGDLVSPLILQTLLSLVVRGVAELCPKQAEERAESGNRHFRQYRLFVRLVHVYYSQQHQVTFYAREMDLKPAALCRLIKRESGRTAMEIINNAILLDAKAQLRTCDAPVKDIALSLGFNNAAFFNKFFKRHVGMTPQTFRNYRE